MIPLAELWIFILAAFVLVITPGPNMIYLISRSITQGCRAGLISLTGVIMGFLFHSLMISFGLTAIFMAIPYAFFVLKALGVIYLLYLAFQAIRPAGTNIFEPRKDLKIDPPGKLFMMGFLTNVLNPKIAVFYLSFYPQFLQPELGSLLVQSFQLTLIQMSISFSINFIIVISAARLATWFKQKPAWLRVQKWFMASVLTWMAVKMAVTKAK